MDIRVVVRNLPESPPGFNVVYARRGAAVEDIWVLREHIVDKLNTSYGGERVGGAWTVVGMLIVGSGYDEVVL